MLYSRREGGLIGADLRVALLELYKLLKAVDSDIKLLLEPGVRISEVLYAGEERCTPKTIFQHSCCTCMGTP